MPVCKLSTQQMGKENQEFKAILAYRVSWDQPELHETCLNPPNNEREKESTLSQCDANVTSLYFTQGCGKVPSTTVVL